MRFEPAGLTNDADIRTAKSIVDYIFRWMGKKFLTVDQQEEIGILSPEVRARLAQGYANGGRGAAEAPAAPADAAPPGQTALFNAWEDAVECSKCGGRMVRLALATRAATAARTPAVADSSLDSTARSRIAPWLLTSATMTFGARASRRLTFFRRTGTRHPARSTARGVQLPRSSSSIRERASSIYRAPASNGGRPRSGNSRSHRTATSTSGRLMASSTGKGINPDNHSTKASTSTSL